MNLVEEINHWNSKEKKSLNCFKKFLSKCHWSCEKFRCFGRRNSLVQENKQTIGNKKNP
jgi:hypothetical protein